MAEHSRRSGSGTFRGIADRGRWWVKPTNGLHGARASLNEWIVGRAGALIEAPVCETALVRIPEELAGEEFAPGVVLVPGFASGSRHVERVVEERTLSHRAEDDNRARHAGVFALYDWCWGADDQWLYAAADHNTLYSHDHGFYLTGRGWTVESLRKFVDHAHQPTASADGLDTATLERYATRLDAVSDEELAGMLRAVPPGWPVSADELNAVGWFLSRRAEAVARRLRGLAEDVARGAGT